MQHTSHHKSAKFSSIHILDGSILEIWHSSEWWGPLITFLSCNSKLTLVECIVSQQSSHWSEPQSSQWKVATVDSDLQHNFSAQKRFEVLVLNFLTLVIVWNHLDRLYCWLKFRYCLSWKCESFFLFEVYETFDNLCFSRVFIGFYLLSNNFRMEKLKIKTFCWRFIPKIALWERH